MWFLIYVSLIGIGAFGALAFALDYSRSADLRQPISRQLLVLNTAMGLLLLLVFLRHIFSISDNAMGYVLATLLLIAVIDVAIFYQWYLMRQTRKEQRKLNG